VEPEGAAETHYLKKNGLMLDPWIMVWQLVHGVSSDDPAVIP
jgi:hypothetical protein